MRYISLKVYTIFGILPGKDIPCYPGLENSLHPQVPSCRQLPYRMPRYPIPECLILGRCAPGAHRLIRGCFLSLCGETFCALFPYGHSQRKVYLWGLPSTKAALHWRRSGRTAGPHGWKPTAREGAEGDHHKDQPLRRCDPATGSRILHGIWKSTAQRSEKHQTRLHYWGDSLCNFEELPLQFWVFLLYTKHDYLLTLKPLSNPSLPVVDFLK